MHRSYTWFFASNTHTNTSWICALHVQYSLYTSKFELGRLSCATDTRLNRHEAVYMSLSRFPLWSSKTKNRDASTGKLARLSVYLFACSAHSFVCSTLLAPPCSLHPAGSALLTSLVCSTTLICSLPRSFIHSVAHSGLAAFSSSRVPHSHRPLVRDAKS